MVVVPRERSGLEAVARGEDGEDGEGEKAVRVLERREEVRV